MPFTYSYVYHHNHGFYPADCLPSGVALIIEPQMRLGPYVVIKPLGSGGQASVWQVVNPAAPESPLAMKLIDLRDATAKQVARIRQEARIMRSIEHPSLVVPLAVWEDLERAVLGVVMPLVVGNTLREVIDQKQLTPSRVSWIAVHLAGVLAATHQAQIVHRDLKPGNVMLTQAFWEAPNVAEHVKLLDFGIALRSGGQRITTTGTTIGTPGYMAPEVLLGHGADNPTADVFAYGVVLWEMLFGGHPTGLPPDTPTAKLAVYYENEKRHRSPRWPDHEFDNRWWPVIHAALALEPRQRARDGLALLNLATAAATGQAPEPASPRSSAASVSSRHRPSRHKKKRAPTATVPHVAPPTSDVRTTASDSRPASLPAAISKDPPSNVHTDSNSLPRERKPQPRKSRLKRIKEAIKRTLWSIFRSLAWMLIGSVLTVVALVAVAIWLFSPANLKALESSILEPGTPKTTPPHLPTVHVPINPVPTVRVPTRPPPQVSKKQTQRIPLAGTIHPEDTLWLRPSGIRTNKETTKNSEVFKTHFPHARICLSSRSHPSWQCFSFDRVHGDKKMKVMGSDLIKDGLDIRIYRDSSARTPFFQRRHLHFKGVIKCTALSKHGARLSLHPKKTSTLQLTYFSFFLESSHTHCH